MERSLGPRTAAILSLSLLTVMAGAAVAPALEGVYTRKVWYNGRKRDGVITDGCELSQT